MFRRDKYVKLYNAVLNGHVETVREILSTLKDTPEDINELKKVLISATKEIKKSHETVDSLTETLEYIDWFYF